MAGFYTRAAQAAIFVMARRDNGTFSGARPSDRFTLDGIGEAEAA